MTWAMTRCKFLRYQTRFVCDSARDMNLSHFQRTSQNLLRQKNLAQAKVKRLYFIWPNRLEGDSKKALQIMEDAGMEVVPMDVPDLDKLQEAIGATVERLKKAESENKLPFSKWPSNTGADYELQPEKL